LRPFIAWAIPPPPLTTARPLPPLPAPLQYTLGNRAKNVTGGGQDDVKTRMVMYKFHEDQTRQWLTGTLLPRLGTTGEALLGAFAECWRAHRLFVEWTRKMFVYLDSDAKREGSLLRHDSLTSVGLRLFKVACGVVTGLCMVSQLVAAVGAVMCAAPAPLMPTPCVACRAPFFRRSCLTRRRAP
jgi:hypothetical protein